MQYADLRLRGVRTAVVMVGVGQLHNESLIARLQRQFALPVMLVARDEAIVKGMRAYAQFDAAPYLFALLASEDVEWRELPAEEEQDLPF
jgi:hypothetical protein